MKAAIFCVIAIWVGSAGAFDPAHVERLRNTGGCETCDLSGFKFPVNANLSNTNLSGANLSKANLSGADLGGIPGKFRVDLSNANLTGANLSKANLFNANLSGANLSDVDLSDANLTGTIGQKRF